MKSTYYLSKLKIKCYVFIVENVKHFLISIKVSQFQSELLNLASGWNVLPRKVTDSRPSKQTKGAWKTSCLRREIFFPLWFLIKPHSLALRTLLIHRETLHPFVRFDEPSICLRSTILDSTNLDNFRSFFSPPPSSSIHIFHRFNSFPKPLHCFQMP